MSVSLWPSKWLLPHSEPLECFLLHAGSRQKKIFPQHEVLFYCLFFGRSQTVLFQKEKTSNIIAAFQLCFAFIWCIIKWIMQCSSISVKDFIQCQRSPTLTFIESFSFDSSHGFFCSQDEAEAEDLIKTATFFFISKRQNNCTFSGKTLHFEKKMNTKINKQQY